MQSDIMVLSDKLISIKGYKVYITDRVGNICHICKNQSSLTVWFCHFQK